MINRFNLLSLDVNTLDACHRKEQVLNQEGLLDVNWEGAKILWALFSASLSLLVFDKSCILGRYVIVIKMRSLEQPVRQMGDRCLDYLEHAGWRYLWSLS